MKSTAAIGWPRAVGSRRGLILCVVLTGASMAILDVSIVNVAIPSIRRDLHASFGGAETVIAAYTLAYGCLLVTGGRLGDLYGRRRLFIIGVACFAAASALCGAAPSLGVLITARAIQGMAAAVMYPQVLSIIQLTYSGRDRAKALAIFGSVAGIAVIAGQLVGGGLLALNVLDLTWRSVFLVNVPLGVITATSAALVLPADRNDGSARIDPGGLVLLMLALLLLTAPLLEGRDEHWPAWMIICLVASVPLLVTFIRYERRLAARGGQPLVRLGLFRIASFARGVPIGLLFTFSYAGFLLILAVYLQSGLGFSPLHAGLSYTPNAVGFLLASLVAPRLVLILGRHVLTVGYLIAAMGLLGTAATAAAAGGRLNGLELAPALFIAGTGQGLGMSPLVGTIISAVQPRDAGAASGIVTTVLQVGNALGVALTGMLFFSLLGGGRAASSYATAFAGAVLLSAAAITIAAVAVHRLPLTQYEVENALIERAPGWAAGLAYSMFLMTGGRIGDRLFDEIRSHVSERRLQRVADAPMPPGKFLAYHFRAANDGPWLRYLLREALAYGSRTVPSEAQRLPVIQAQVDEIRVRQRAGLVDPAIDPDLLRLLVFALVNYPRLLPQITRMVTGSAPGDPAFAARWEEFLGQIGERLQPQPARIGTE